MDRTLTVAELADRIGVSTNHVRYVLDSDMLPGRREGLMTGSITAGRGVTRQLSKFEAFGVALVVLMLAAGIRRELVCRLLDLMTRYAPGTRDMTSTLIHQAYADTGVLALEIGDSVNARLTYDWPEKKRSDEWMQVQTGARVIGYVPQVSVSVDLVRLRRVVKS